MDMEIVDVESRETVLRHSFDQKMILKVKKARTLPEKISEILYIELLKIEAELKKDKS